MRTVENDFHRKLLEEIHDGVYFVDPERKITYWNKAAERITGYPRQEVLGLSCKENILIHINCKGLELCDLDCPLSKAIHTDTSSEIETFLRHRKGHRVPVAVRCAPVKDEGGNILGAVEIFSDSSQIELIKQQIKELERLALIDHLTGLPNRRYAEEELSVRLAEKQRYSWPFGILMMDLDHFKDVNDTYGHDVGDEVLRVAGRTLLHNARPFDLVGRWGGEEFVSIIRNVDADNLHNVAERFRIMVEKSRVSHNDETLNVTISLGGTLALAGDTPEAIIRRADDMMYESKNSGRNRVTLE
jgi:diguanylate cyclase (GGDEF)-like protein/PAS domain S-box-containing protein